MKIIKNPLLLIWRFWFYILMATIVIIISPLLLILTTKQEYYPQLWKLIRVVSKVLIYGMGFRLKIEFDEQIDRNKSYMFCPNHSSLIDPFVLILTSKNPIVFVGKIELAKVPVFGFFYKKIVIMVDRSSMESRKRVYEMAKKRLKNGTSIAIFPEGLVPDEDVILSPFKKGAFRLAIEYQTPIVPQVYLDCKRMFSWDFLKGGPGTLRVKQHQFIETKGLSMNDTESLKEKLFALMYNELSGDTLYMDDTNRVKKSNETRTGL